MKNHSQVPVPASFWIITVLALLWNGFGVMAYAARLLMTPETFAALPEIDQQLINTTPEWVNIAFGVAVIFGVLASLMLVFRKKLAINLFLISMLAVFVQMSHMFILSDMFQVKGWAMAAMPAAIIVVAIFLWRYAVSAHSKYWLN